MTYIGLRLSYVSDSSSDAMFVCASARMPSTIHHAALSNQRVVARVFSVASRELM